MKSFLHGKKAVPIPALWAPGPGVHTKPGIAGLASSLEGKPQAPEHAPRPTVEVVKEGDKVVRVFVTCSCGERIELECLYPAGA